MIFKLMVCAEIKHVAVVKIESNITLKNLLLIIMFLNCLLEIEVDGKVNDN